MLPETGYSIAFFYYIWKNTKILIIVDIFWNYTLQYNEIPRSCPFSPTNNQDRISLYTIGMISSEQVMKIQKNIS